VTPDGRYLIFAASVGSLPTSTICRLPMRSSFVKHTKVLNGSGNLYRIPMSYVFDITRPNAKT
jgi:hypothetical protein